MDLRFLAGEKCIYRLSGKGLRCNANIFELGEVKPLPPSHLMRSEGVSMAYVHSCPLSVPLKKISFEDGLIRYVDDQYRHYYVDVSGSFDNYLDGFRRKTLSTIKRKTKKVAKSCQGQFFRAYCDGGEIMEFYDQAVGISLRSFQHRLFGHGLPETDEFKRELVASAEQGTIVGLLLFVNDLPVAYSLCPIYGKGVMLYDRTGYDPDFHHFSPGTVLQFKTIEFAFQTDQVSTYDLCTGEGQHKELFAKDYKWCGNIYFFPLRLKYLLAVYAKCATDRCTDVTTTLLDKVGLKAKIKQYFRRMA